MRELISTLHIIIVIAAAVIGILVIGYSIWLSVETTRENTKERYFQCLDKTEKLTCDNIFYKYQTRE